MYDDEQQYGSARCAYSDPSIKVYGYEALGIFT